MPRTPIVPSFSAVCVVLAVLSGAPVSAQMENLQVLPADMSRGEVTDLMRTFTSALGVRCSACHVGEEGAPLSEYDFASDDLVLKRKAREMMRMVREINTVALAALPDRAPGEPMVTCATCHGGLLVPMPIEEVVETTIAADGLDAAAARYAELRERYFGGRQYDFSESHLLGMARDAFRAEAYDRAETFYGLAVRYFDTSVAAHLGRGQVAEARGEPEVALVHYRRVLELDPENAQALRRLEALGG